MWRMGLEWSVAHACGLIHSMPRLAERTSLPATTQTLQAQSLWVTTQSCFLSAVPALWDGITLFPAIAHAL